MSERIATYDAFWTYYLSEHTDPRCRWLHLVGTSGFWVVFLGACLTAPMRMLLATTLSVALIAACWKMEGRRSGGLVLIAVIAAAGLANPDVLWGVVWAYGFAWVGHFALERNRPATFTYPLWSLGSDFRMTAEMLRGRFWTGHLPHLET